MSAVKGVKETPDQRLARLLESGFYREVTFRYIKKLENNKVICTTVDYYAQDHPCNCGSGAFVVLRPERVGVYRTCAWCTRTTGPLSKEAGLIRDSKEISVPEAVAILQARNAHVREIANIIKAQTPTKQVAAKRPRPKKVS